MLRKFLIGCGVLLLILLVAGGFLFYRINRLSKAVMPNMPDELKVAKVVVGVGRFSRESYYHDPRLGVITDIEQDPSQGYIIVGQSGAAFLTGSGSATRSTHFAECRSEVVLFNLDGGAFLCRGGWNTDARLFDSDGKTVWSYGGGLSGIDDAAAGVLGGENARRVVVGFNGGGGVRLLSAEGKELWKKDDGNVWHVEVAASDERATNVILHSNARGQLTVRDENGNMVGTYSPEIYLAHFELTAWDRETRRNKLVTTDGRYLYVLSMTGKTIARLPVPGSASIAEAKGTPFHLSGGIYYAGVLRHFIWTRSLLYIYDPQNQLAYEEILDHDCASLSSSREENGTGSLLVGCNGDVWKYSQAKGN